MDGYVVSNSDVLYHTLFESFSDAGAVSCQGLYAGWFALSFPAVVRAGIWNFARVPAIARPTLHEGRRGIFNILIHQLMPADGTPSFMSIGGTATH